MGLPQSKYRSEYFPSIKDVEAARERIKDVIQISPLNKNFSYSEGFQSNISFKREDLQSVRSYKIRGAFNKISSLPKHILDKGIVCASAGNHAQGVALSCLKLDVHGTIFMPRTTPKQKVDKVKMFGKNKVDVILEGDTFDDSFSLASDYVQQNQLEFIHPFDDPLIIEGQATVALELLEQSKEPIDYLFLPIGGGGLAAGISSVFSQLSPTTKIIGAEPKGAESMAYALQENASIALNEIDKFVDGAAVKKVGFFNFQICKDLLHEVKAVHSGKICETILKLYNEDGIVAEPAGALSIACLNQYETEIKNKNVVCILSGGNNDITRTEEIKERALLHSGLKHYFIVEFPQRPGALKEFVIEVLGESDDITFFEYVNRNSRERGSATVGIQLNKASDFEPLLKSMTKKKFLKEYLNDKPHLMQILI